MSRGNTPTIKRILRESLELSSHPSPDIHATPLSDADLFEWHFTIRGPSPPSAFSNGIYHGRIILPSTYPLRPPSFRFLTPSGRFEVNREICLSISGHHEETWQPAWGIRTALVAIRAFMDSKVDGQVGGLECSEEVRVRLAGLSRVWKCTECGRTNEEILEEETRKCEEEERKGGKKRESKNEEEKVPEGLRVGYREDLHGKNANAGDRISLRPSADTETLLPPNNSSGLDASLGGTIPASSSSSSTVAPLPTRTPLAEMDDLSDGIVNQYPPPPRPAPQPVPEHLRRQLQLYLHPMHRPAHEQPNRNQNHQAVSTLWLDRTIFALLFLLIGMVWRKFGIDSGV